MIATMTIEEATDGDIFLAYLDHCLCPQLREGDVVVLASLIGRLTHSEFNSLVLDRHRSLSFA
jgi:hypothetical protein